MGVAERSGAEGEGASRATDLLGPLPVLESFAEIADDSRYGSLPSDWVVGVADVVNSTDAIGRGDYKAVNVAGAAVIAAVSNALGSLSFHYVFGGDGASFVVPPEAAGRARSALAATATLAREELGLTLRVATLPVSAIREAGLDLRLARVAISPDVSQTLFSGGGIAWAETRLKEGAFALEPAPPGTRPDLSGLSCRFEPMRSRRGVILSIIVRRAGGAEARYRELIADLLRLVETSPGMARPVPGEGPRLGWSVAGALREARLSRPAGRPWLFHVLRVFARTLAAFAILRLRVPVGRFRPARYLGQIVANSDYRKYDDGLRMTIDCDERLASAIASRLEAAAAAGIAAFGLHRQDAALMTCITPSPTEADHIHFIDGAAGGYAAAATALKGMAPRG